MSDRPDYVHCVSRPRANAMTYWCDRIVTGEFAFTGVDHVLANHQVGGRLLPCTRCVEAIQAELDATEIE